MFRAGIITAKGIIGKTLETKEQAEEYILEVSEKEEVKRADILDRKTGIRERIF